jgi:hypothetical protein
MQSLTSSLDDTDSGTKFLASRPSEIISDLGEIVYFVVPF